MKTLYYMPLLATLVFLPFAVAEHRQEEKGVESAKTLQAAELMETVKDKRVLFVGESHFSRIDHAIQLSLIRHLSTSGKKLAIAIEMAPESMQPVLDRWNRGEMGETEFAVYFSQAWKVPYTYYGAIFRFARDNRIPLLGIDFDRAHTMRLMEKGMGMMPKETLDLIKFESCSDNPKYTNDMAQYWERLGHTRDFKTLCDVRRFREAVMAYNIVQLLERDSYTVIVLLGASHAAKPAVPAMLERHSDAGYTVLLPEILGNLTRHRVTTKEADLKW